MSKASAERIVEVLDEESDLHNPENPITEVASGDVDFEQVEPVAGAITPVPGGVGPMTIAMLMNNCVEAMTR